MRDILATRPSRPAITTCVWHGEWFPVGQDCPQCTAERDRYQQPPRPSFWSRIRAVLHR